MTALRIAIRYLLARKSHTAVNVISYISMAGIAVAAMAMVCVLSVFNGFSDLASERLSMVDPDIKVSSISDKIISNADSLALELEKIPGVSSALPTLRTEAMAIYGDMQSPVNVIGVPVGFGQISALNSLVIDGEMNSSTYSRRGAVLSVGTAIYFGARPSGELPLYLTVPRRIERINPAFPMAAFTIDTLSVCAVYQTNQTELDNGMIIVPLANVRRLLDYTTEAGARDVGVHFPGADRLRQQSHSFRMISIEKWITFLMLVFVLVMASFNILSSMSMLIIEKEESLMILSSFGAPLRMLGNIFLYQGLLVSVTGGVIGITIGVVLCVLQQHYGLITLSGDHTQMSIVNYPCALRFTDVLVTASAVAVIGLLSGLISSRSVRPPANIHTYPLVD